MMRNPTNDKPRTGTEESTSITAEAALPGARKGEKRKANRLRVHALALELLRQGSSLMTMAEAIERARTICSTSKVG